MTAENENSSAVNIGKDANGSNIIVGHHNTINVEYRSDPRPTGPLFSIPAPPTNFIGRADEIADLLAHFDNGVAISGLSGGGGVGKSALARVLAEKLANQYPDARIQLDLQGAPHSGQTPLTPVDALRRLLQSFHPIAQLPDDEQTLKAMLTDTLRGKRVLFLLDNARDAAQVRPLLPPAPSAAIITSRTFIPFIGRNLYAKTIDRLLLPEARDLLRTAPRLQNADDATLNALAEQCGALPLALNVVASLLESRPDWSPAHLIERLASERTRLALLKMDGDPDLDVEASLSLSYNQLDEEKQRLFRTLGIFPAPFDLPALGALWDMPPAACDDTIGFFLRLSLLETRPGAMPYRLHDLTRIYAEDRLREQVDEWGVVVQRHADYFLLLLVDANDLYLRGHDYVLESLRKFETIWLHLQVAYERSLLATDNRRVARWLSNLCSKATYIFELRLHPRQRILMLEHALSAARRLKDQNQKAIHLGNLGNAYYSLEESRFATKFFNQQLVITRKIGDHRGEAAALTNLGNVYKNQRQPRLAIEHHEKAITIFRNIGDRRSEGAALCNLGNAYYSLGEPEIAIEHHKQALFIDREIGDRHAEGVVIGSLGIDYVDKNKLDEAMLCYEQQQAITREIGDKSGEAVACWNMGWLFEAQRQFQHAAELMQVRVDYFYLIGHKDAEKLAKQVEEVRKKIGS